MLEVFLLRDIEGLYSKDELLLYGFKFLELDFFEPLVIAQNQNGKPYIKDCSDIFFNFSDTKDSKAIAISDEEVGIDVESIRKKELLCIAKKLLFDYEMEKLEKFSDAERLNFLCRRWTQVESFYKLSGVGIRNLGCLKLDVAFLYEADGFSVFSVTKNEERTFIYSFEVKNGFLSVASKKEALPKINFIEGLEAEKKWKK